MIVLLTIAIISFLSNYFINRQFSEYIARQQELRVEVIKTSLSQQFNQLEGQWNLDYIYSIGMYSLYEGYIIKVYDEKKQILWDAQSHDMNLCQQIINEVSERMRIQYPQLHGEFTFSDYQLEQGGTKVGSVSIGYYGPFFLDDNEFWFLNALNLILISVGAISLAISLIVGHMLAKRLSNPIYKTVEATKLIADGNYEVRIEEGTNIKELNILENSINHLAVSLNYLENIRKQLTEDVAHELRTPITILQTHLEAMIEGVWQPTSERLQSCNEETIRIGKLVNDLEQLAKFEKDNLNLNKIKINLYELINKIVGIYEGEINNKNLTVNVIGKDIIILADQDRINQVVINLLSNAVKYSKEEGEIEFRLFETETSLGFEICDKGNGIPKKELPFIFERFYRADKSRNRLTGGSGIGLTIVKSIVEAHGGNIKVESKINQGSCFVVTLPKSP